MSARTRTLRESTRRALEHACPDCGAIPGRWCHSPGGKRLDSVVHAARRALVPIDSPAVSR